MGQFPRETVRGAGRLVQGCWPVQGSEERLEVVTGGPHPGLAVAPSRDGTRAAKAQNFGPPCVRAAPPMAGVLPSPLAAIPCRIQEGQHLLTVRQTPTPAILLQTFSNPTKANPATQLGFRPQRNEAIWCCKYLGMDLCLKTQVPTGFHFKRETTWDKTN